MASYQSPKRINPTHLTPSPAASAAPLIEQPITITAIPTPPSPHLVDSMDQIPWCTSLYPAAMDPLSKLPAPIPALIAALYLARMTQDPLSEMPISLPRFMEAVADIRVTYPNSETRSGAYYNQRADGLEEALNIWPSRVAQGTTALQILGMGPPKQKEACPRVLIMLFDRDQKLDRVFLSGQAAYDGYANTRALALTALGDHFSTQYPWAVSPAFIPSPEPVSGSINALSRALCEATPGIEQKRLICAEHGVSRHMAATKHPCTQEAALASGYTQLTLWIGPTTRLDTGELKHMSPASVTWQGTAIDAILQVVAPCEQCQKYDKNFGFYQAFIKPKPTKRLAKSLETLNLDHAQKHGTNEGPRVSPKRSRLSPSHDTSYPCPSPNEHNSQGTHISPFKQASRLARLAKCLHYTDTDSKGADGAGYSPLLIRYEICIPHLHSI